MLAETSNGDIQSSYACRGKDSHRDLRGSKDGPRIADQRAIYLFRQMRDGGDVSVKPMLSAVKNLTDVDLIALSAYAASREP